MHTPWGLDVFEGRLKHALKEMHTAQNAIEMDVVFKKNDDVLDKYEIKVSGDVQDKSITDRFQGMELVVKVKSKWIKKYLGGNITKQPKTGTT